MGAASFCLAAAPEVRGTWLTTTANHALATPADTATTMRRLKRIGINTVYVESWKDGYTQFPSEVLQKAIGHRQRPSVPPARDLLQESLIEAHRNGLIHVAWFEYGFMAAHKDTMNALRLQKPGWLSRDIHGSEIAPNGFVWLNPLHPEARAFLRDLIIEAIDNYDIDGIQLDDRIVWPHVTMGYDDYTQQVYAAEHGGRKPPSDHTDPAWMRWRAAKVSEFARMLVREVRARRPRMLVSLSPAVYPWSWDHYLLDWPAWSAWSQGERWDEFIPQAYRFSYEAFEKTWRQQVEAVRTKGGNRQRDLVAGIRIVGEGADSEWSQLRRSILLARELGNGGHVLWYSRGVLDLYQKELTAFYRASGSAVSPHFGAGWREVSAPLSRHAGGKSKRGIVWWRIKPHQRYGYRVIGYDGVRWHYLDGVGANGDGILALSVRYSQVELVRDRRALMATGFPARMTAPR